MAADPAPPPADAVTPHPTPSPPLDPRRGGPVGALTRDDVIRAVAYVDALAAARGDPRVYADDERAGAQQAPPPPAPKRAAAAAAAAAATATATATTTSHPAPTTPAARALSGARAAVRSVAAGPAAAGSEPGSLAFEASPKRSSFGLDEDDDSDAKDPHADNDDRARLDALGMGAVRDRGRANVSARGSSRAWQHKATAAGAARGNPFDPTANAANSLPCLSINPLHPTANATSTAKRPATRDRSTFLHHLARLISVWSASRNPRRRRDDTTAEDPKHTTGPESSRYTTTAKQQRGAFDYRRRSAHLRFAGREGAGSQVESFSHCPPHLCAAWAATEVVAAAAKRMNNDDAPGITADVTDESLLSRRAAHRLLLAVLGFDGAHGLVAVGKPEYVDDKHRDEVLDLWTLADTRLALSCKAYKAHVKATSMLSAVCCGLQDAVRALDRASAAAKKENGSQSPGSPPSSFRGILSSSTASSAAMAGSKPNRFWADAREKATQVSFVLGKLYKYNPDLPVVCLLRDARPGHPGPFRTATANLSDPMPLDPVHAAKRIELVRNALLDARELALETLEQTSALVETASNDAIEARHAKILADTSLIESRYKLVQQALTTLETDPVSLRLIFEITEIIKAQEREAGFLRE